VPVRSLALILAGGLVLVAVASAAAGTGDAASLAAGHTASPADLPTFGTYDWPVDGPVIRGFDAAETPYGPGHRGIDIAASPGTAVRAAADGIVAFAGRIAGAFYVSVDHPDGVRTTYSWLETISVRRGQDVLRGVSLGTTGAGHPGTEPPHLHFGARLADRYVDPMLLLARPSVAGLIRLAPLEGATQPGGRGAVVPT
jgi:murein DD-endopeptidase MepM/ murein hydrolase activator NlpD